MADRIIGIVGLSFITIMFLPFTVYVLKLSAVKFGQVVCEYIVLFFKAWLAAWRCVFKRTQIDGDENESL